MAAPFVISMKFTSDASGVKSTNGEIRRELSQLDAALETSRGKAVALQTAFDTKASATAVVSAYTNTLELIDAERRLEMQRHQAQISDTGRAQSLNRMAQLSRDAAAASQALASAEVQVANAQQLIEQSAAGAATAIANLADRQARVTALQSSGINQRLGVSDDFGGASRAADIEAYGRELDELRARYNPLYALERRRAANIEEITKAQRLGAISAREMETAVRAEEAAFQRSVTAINASTDALQRNQIMAANGASQFNTANVAAQFQDIAVTSAMGMSPMQIALQQGTQISAAFGNAGAAGAVKMLGSAFLSIISPVSLATIALVAGASAAIQYFMSLGNGAEDIDERLEKHLERVEALAKGYDGPIDAAKKYVEEAMKAPVGAVESNAQADRSTALKSALTVLDQIEGKEQTIGAWISNLRFNQAIFGDLISAVEGMEDLGLSASSTLTEVNAVITSLTQLANDDAAPEQARVYARDMLALVEQFKAANIEAGGFKVLLESMPGEVRVRLTLQSDAMADLRDVVPDQRSRFDIMRAENDAAFQKLSQNAQTYGAISSGQRQYQDNIKVIDKLEAEHNAKTTARSARQVSAYERQIKTIRERIAAQELETNVIGLGTYATERARIELELQNAAREDATGLSAARIAEIGREASAYAHVTATLERQRGAYDAVSGVIESTIDTAVDGFLDAEGSILDVIANIGKEWVRMVTQMAVTNPIKNAILGQNNPVLGDIGALLGNLFGGGAATGAKSAVSLIPMLPKLASGTNSAAGGRAIINDGTGGEIVDLPSGTRVWPADLSRLMAQNSGGAGGVTVVNQTNITNAHPTARVREREVSDGRGGKRQEILIDEIVSSAISRRGGASQASMAFAGMLPDR